MCRLATISERGGPHTIPIHLLIEGVLKPELGNGTLTLLSSLQPFLFADNLVQRSVERVSFYRIPLNFVCEAVGFFGHVKELECTDIKDPQQVCMCRLQKFFGEKQQQTPAKQVCVMCGLVLYEVSQLTL